VWSGLLVWLFCWSRRGRGKENGKLKNNNKK
jgi:hypothetical protein